MAYRVLIVGNSTGLADDIAGILKKEGYQELYIAPDGKAAVEMARQYPPEMVIMDVDLPGEDSIAVAKRILEECLVPIVMHAEYTQTERIMEADGMGVSAHLFRPVMRENLLAAIALGASRFRQCQMLHAEIGDCREALRVRKLVERAKGILMKRGAKSEEEAFLKIQRLSRDSNISMEKVAESIITASEVI